MDVKELAAKAADEIERRGWTRGALARYHGQEVNDDGVYYDATIGAVRADLDTCEVCVLGALSAAYFGNPLNGYSEEADFMRLKEDIASEINPSVLGEPFDDGVMGVMPADDPIHRALWEWNDNWDDSEGRDAVPAKLRDIAAA